MDYRLLLFTIIFFSSAIVAQNQDEYFDNNFIRYDNHIYKENIRTVQIYREGWPLSYPVLELHSEDILHLCFDDFSSEIKDYSYTTIHCSHNWEPSDLQPQEYISGFDQCHDFNYKYSFNTIDNFIHYSFSFPNENMKPKISGNYIIKVFEDFNQENPVITRRFYIVDSKISIEAKIKQPFHFDYKTTHHEIDFSIDHSGLKINDPIDEIKVLVSQNFRMDNAIENLKPLFIKENILEYDYDEENLFQAGSEFRNFDLKSLRYQSEFIKDVELLGDEYHVRLTDDISRSFGVYFTEADINGRRLIYKQEAENHDVEADYVWVYFNLPYDYPLTNGSLYVFGDFCDYQFKEENKMVYNFETKSYQLKMFLKQGYYNYQYVFLEDGKKSGDNSIIEGSHYETENDYIIFVYHKDFRTGYDKLIGFSIFNSLRQGGIEIEGPFKNFNLKIDKLFRK
ncbi:MAG: DUF5103 domain-containing protein [Bacteroidales bacterium]|nr:DUF5103 domain-containing protein [Bacteroidales bacterium]